MTVGLQLGRPGVYLAPPTPRDELQAVRLDIAGFVGVALRGPTDTPTPVTTWSEYEQTFGGFERTPGAPERLLPYAVQAFFAQGGQRAYVLRLAPGPDFDGPSAVDATARFALVGRPGLELAAADEGTWGSTLRLWLEFEVSRSFRTEEPVGTTLLLPAAPVPADQSVLLIHRRGLPGTGALRRLTRLTDPALRDSWAELDQALPAAPEGTTGGIQVDVVTGVLVASDPSSSLRRDERIRGLGLLPGHPRFVAKVLGATADGEPPGLSESALCRATSMWGPVLPDEQLSPITTTRTNDGQDRSHGVDYASLFDDGPADADLLDELLRHRGVDAMGRVEEIGLLAVPDLTWRSYQLPEQQPRDVAPRRRTHCEVCDPPVEPVLPPLPPAPPGLDARVAADRGEIVTRQLRAVEVAMLRRRFVLLLDVPAGLSLQEVTSWRAHFDTSYAAVYHPWLGVAPSVAGDGSTTAVMVPPSAFAAGIIAAREIAHGVSWGPANELAVGAVVARDVVTDALHDQLHLLGVNVLRAERDGFRLSAARTVSSDPDYRQLSVRRLMTQLAETLRLQCQWLVFEPSTPDLRLRLTHAVTLLLRDMQRHGAFAGATEEESFFVRCDDSTNPPSSQALGRLVAEIGVAPAAPLEYIVLRLSADVEGAVSLEATGG